MAVATRNLREPSKALINRMAASMASKRLAFEHGGRVQHAVLSAVIVTVVAGFQKDERALTG